MAFRKAARVNADPNSPESWVDDGLANPAPDLLPLGLDSHRYRCCGNGVVSNVSEWIGVRLAAAVAEVGERAA